MYVYYIVNISRISQVYEGNEDTIINLDYHIHTV